MSRACPHRYEDVGICPDRERPGRGSHRQRQYLLVELADNLGMANGHGQ